MSLMYLGPGRLDLAVPIADDRAITVSFKDSAGAAVSVFDLSDTLTATVTDVEGATVATLTATVASVSSCTIAYNGGDITTASRHYRWRLRNATDTVDLLAGEWRALAAGDAGTPTAGSIDVVTGNGAVTVTAVVSAFGVDGDWSTGQTVRTISGTSDTPTSTDAGKALHCTSGSAVTITLNASLGLTAGQSFTVIQLGAGQVSFVADGVGVSVAGNPTAKLRGQYCATQVYCTAANTYVLFGDLAVV